MIRRLTLTDLITQTTLKQLESKWINPRMRRNHLLRLKNCFSLRKLVLWYVDSVFFVNTYQKPPKKLWRNADPSNTSSEPLDHCQRRPDFVTGTGLGNIHLNLPNYFIFFILIGYLNDVRKDYLILLLKRFRKGLRHFRVDNHKYRCLDTLNPMCSCGNEVSHKDVFNSFMMEVRII